MLQLHHIHHVEFTTRGQDFTGAGPAVGIGPGITDSIEIGIIWRGVVAVGGLDITTFWIEFVRLGGDG